MFKTALAVLILSVMTFSQTDISVGTNNSKFTLPAGRSSEYDEESGMHLAGSGDGKINLLIQEIPVTVGQVIEELALSLKVH
ncbi:MAG: hypothetical protein HUU43_16870 [Ignavibacteriaceae bacterium]|nr:hypothetical protein [Ignavibacteriaceae bacterium]